MKLSGMVKTVNILLLLTILTLTHATDCLADSDRPQTDTDYLMIFKYVPFDATNEEVQEIVTNLKEHEDRNNRLHYRKTLVLFERDGLLEFKFDKAKQLYRVSITFLGVGRETAQDKLLRRKKLDKLYKQIKKFYQKNVGEFIERNNDEILELAKKYADKELLDEGAPSRQEKWISQASIWETDGIYIVVRKLLGTAYHKGNADHIKIDFTRGKPFEIGDEK